MGSLGRDVGLPEALRWPQSAVNDQSYRRGSFSPLLRIISCCLQQVGGLGVIPVAPIVHKGVELCLRAAGCVWRGERGWPGRAGFPGARTNWVSQVSNSHCRHKVCLSLGFSVLAVRPAYESVTLLEASFCILFYDIP